MIDALSDYYHPFINISFFDIKNINSEFIQKRVYNDEGFDAFNNCLVNNVGLQFKHH